MGPGAGDEREAAEGESAEDEAALAFEREVRRGDEAFGGSDCSREVGDTGFDVAV